MRPFSTHTFPTTDTEEEVFYPWLSKRCTVPEKMSTDHKDLMDRMANIEKGLQALVRRSHGGTADDSTSSADLQSARRAAITDLADQVRQLEAVMRPHLAEEEAVLIPLMEKHYKAEEYAELVYNEILPRIQDKSAFELPWMLSHQPPRYTGPFLKGLPGPVLLLMGSCWAPWYKSQVESLLESVLGHDESRSPHSVCEATPWFCCGMRRPCYCATPEDIGMGKGK